MRLVAEVECERLAGELAASRAREGELRAALVSGVPCGDCGKVSAPWHCPYCLGDKAALPAPAPPAGGLLELLAELESRAVEASKRERETRGESAAYHRLTANLLEPIVRRLRDALGLPAAGQREGGR